MKSFRSMTKTRVKHHRPLIRYKYRYLALCWFSIVGIPRARVIETCQQRFRQQSLWITWCTDGRLEVIQSCTETILWQRVNFQVSPWDLCSRERYATREECNFVIPLIVIGSKFSLVNINLTQCQQIAFATLRTGLPGERLISLLNQKRRVCWSFGSG